MTELCGVVPHYIERRQVVPAVTGADQWGSLATGHGRAARGPVWKARPRSLQLERRYKTQDQAILNQGGLRGTEAVPPKA